MVNSELRLIKFTGRAGCEGSAQDQLPIFTGSAAAGPAVAPFRVRPVALLCQLPGGLVIENAGFSSFFGGSENRRREKEIGLWVVRANLVVVNGPCMRGRKDAKCPRNQR